jgi:uncharacterized RmlC-like cupin family protein
MTNHDEFRSELPAARVHHITTLDPGTGQMPGMQRFAAITHHSTGAEKLWMGETCVAPATVSGNHHHGESETAIFVRKGHPEFVFHDGRQEVRVRTNPGDYVFVPPYLPHREANPDPNETAEIVIARSTQEAIVVNIASLHTT